MLPRLRRHLRRIEYYSAARSGDGWERLRDGSLAVALILTVPALWLVDVVFAPLETTADWLLAAAALWVGLYGLMVVGLRVARFAARRLEGRGARMARRRKLRNLCTQCGYDLRGLEFAARCPECGTLTH